jgi:hypothetical protein
LAKEIVIETERSRWKEAGEEKKRNQELCSISGLSVSMVCHVLD